MTRPEWAAELSDEHWQAVESAQIFSRQALTPCHPSSLQARYNQGRYIVAALFGAVKALGERLESTKEYYALALKKIEEIPSLSAEPPE